MRPLKLRAGVSLAPFGPGLLPYVMPRFNRASVAREGSLGWVSDNAGELIGAAASAVMATIQEHLAAEVEQKG